MIILFHSNEKVVRAVLDGKPLHDYNGKNITQVLFLVAQVFPTALIGWCLETLKDEVAIEDYGRYCTHDNMMISASTQERLFLSDAIGYVEDSPFLKLNRNVCYPTWQMSGQAGVMSAAVINQLPETIFLNKSFEYGLNSIAKLCRPKGLFCYQLPQIKIDTKLGLKKASQSDLYKFVGQHYKKQWVVFLLIAHIIYENKWPLISCIQGLFVKRLKFDFSISHINQKVAVPPEKQSIDVIIPTMGRAKYLYDVLQDLASQTLLPQTVVIVEQNQDQNAVSELGYLQDETWPFEIKHRFIHKTGACNARNVALSLTTADWVFFADDDVRFKENLFQKSLAALTHFKAPCIAMSCLQKNEKKTFNQIAQWSSFPSGASMVAGTLSRKLNFDTAYEHGYGEDADYGMQLRNEGADVLYFPDIDLLHLKAPVGGFRHKFVHPWAGDTVLPKPSPTVMLYRLRHSTPNQLKGYKLKLFIGQFSQKKPVNFVRFLKQSKRAWNNAIHWANTLDKKNEV